MKLKASGKTTPFLRVFFFLHFSRIIMFLGKGNDDEKDEVQDDGKQDDGEKEEKNELKYKEEKNV